MTQRIEDLAVGVKKSLIQSRVEYQIYAKKLVELYRQLDYKCSKCIYYDKGITECNRVKYRSQSLCEDFVIDSYGVDIHVNKKGI